ncbi:MAG: hypothetical protein O3A14_09455 [Cyanobacteria bacterium]|nr:hypothetical protein [Cyanobacteriota bacterium]
MRHFDLGVGFALALPVIHMQNLRPAPGGLGVGAYTTGICSWEHLPDFCLDSLGGFSGSTPCYFPKLGMQRFQRLLLRVASGVSIEHVGCRLPNLEFISQ